MAAPKAISTATRSHLTRASYLFVGPGSPANRKYPLVDFEGIDGTGADVGAPMSVLAQIYLALGSAPAATSATYICNAQAVGTTPVAPNNNTSPDVARTLTYVSSNAGDTTQTVTVTGLDMYGQVMHETISLNGTTTVQGKKAFGGSNLATPASGTASAKITTVQTSAALAGTLSVGIGNKLGLPVAVDAPGFLTGISMNAGVPTVDATPTVAYADRTNPATYTTGDVRGTYTPTTAPNGTLLYVVNVFPAMGPNGKTTATYGLTNA